MQERPKPIYYLGSAEKDLLKLPKEVKETFTYGFYLASFGDTHPDSKVMKGFKGTGVVELRTDHKGDTFRGVYTVKFKGAVYVLHVFKKKSHKGIGTPKKDKELIETRLKWAQRHYKETKEKKIKENQS